MPSPATTRTFPVATGIAEIVAARTVTPRMRRFTFGGPDVAAIPLEDPGEFVSFIWPAAGSEEIVLPLAGWTFPPGTPEQHAANYTVRRWDAEAGTIDVDFVLHGDHGAASAWAERAAVGDRLGFGGPRKHWTNADDSAGWTLLLADETGIPALAAIVETLPAWHRAIAVVEVTDRHDHQPLTCAARLDVHWVHRGDAAPGECDALPEALRALALPDGRGRVWGGGESGLMRRLRDHLRDERGIARGSMHLLGYWKHPAVAEWVR